MALVNCTITSSTNTEDTSGNYGDRELLITPNEGFEVFAEDLTVEGVSYGENSDILIFVDGVNGVEFSYETEVGDIIDSVTLSQDGSKVKALVDFEDSYTISENEVITINIAGEATAITDYGLVRPAIIDSAVYDLEETTVDITKDNSATDNIVLVEGISDKDTHYLNADVPLDTWKKIGEVTITTDTGNSGYTFSYPPYLSSNGSEVSLSKFDLIQTSINEDPDTGQITEYGFDLMFKDTGATGFVWPLVPAGTEVPFVGKPYWEWNAITDPDITAALNIKVQIMDLPEYDYVIDGVDLGGGTEDVTSGSDVIPSGGTPPDEPMDTWYAGDAESTFGVSVTEVGGVDVTTEVVGTTTTFTMGASGLQNIPLTFLENQTATTKEYDVVISGTGATAILSQVKKTSGGAHVPYAGVGTSSVTNRYIQLGSTDVNIDITSIGWDTLTSETHNTKTAPPLSSISGRQIGFEIIRHDSVDSDNAAKITGDIFYEKMSYEDLDIEINFEDWFEIVSRNFAPKAVPPSSVLSITNAKGAVVTIANLTPEVVEKSNT